MSEAGLSQTPLASSGSTAPPSSSFASPKNVEDLVATRVRVGAAHLDELAAEVAVEEQVAREVGLVADADVEQLEAGAS